MPSLTYEHEKVKRYVKMIKGLLRIQFEKEWQIF